MEPRSEIHLFWQSADRPQIDGSTDGWTWMDGLLVLGLSLLLAV